MPYTDPDLRRRVNREALRRKRAAERRRAEPRPSPAPQWSPPAPPPVAYQRHTGVLGTPEQRRQRSAPFVQPPAGFGAGHVALPVGALPMVPLGVKALIFVAAVGAVVVIWVLAHRSGDESWEPIE